MSREVWWLKGGGGLVWGHQLPLSEPIADQLARGMVQRVMPPPDRRPWTAERQAELDAELAGDAGRSDLDQPAEGDGEGDAAAGPRRPAQSDPKADWVWFAVASGMAEADAEGMTKQQLIDHDYEQRPY